MVRVLFVCLGNICRSPVAQGVFEELVKREGLDDEIFADSAGTGTWHLGHPPDERAAESALRRGLDISSQKARRLSPDDFDRFDYVLTMDKENFRKVSSMASGEAEVRPFLDYAKDSPESEVPDPYFGGGRGFERVLDLVEEASEGLLEEIKKKRLEDRG
ncbi:MAG: low molecular weight phosphotyrosine protein phosphatase [Actinomycetota bacterium]|nr:low molecular weight phosphotyrosine protein phosphatase [Actinomycetota bacterium]